MSVNVHGTNGITFNDNTTQATSPFAGGLGFRNRIINGDMRIDQRNNGASVTPASSNFVTDRWKFVLTQASKLTAQRSTVATAGFANSLLVTSSSAYSVLAGDTFNVLQPIEGFNTADLGWGTANAQPITLSFWARSSLTGTFGGCIFNSAGNRSYPFTYTVNVVNTFEYKTITIPGDTTGTWLTDSGIGIVVSFGLGSGATFSGTAGSWSSGNFYTATGATSVVGTNGATFYITGVQLEKGSTATSFDYRPYGTELQLCQRYYEKSYDLDVAPGGSTGGGLLLAVCCGNINRAYGHAQFKVSKRATPTITYYSSSGTSGNFRNASQGTNVAVSQATTAGINGSTYIISSGIVSVTDQLQGQYTAEAEL